jgi:hypothetical protein
MMNWSGGLEMIKTKRLNEEGLALFLRWLEAPDGKLPPESLLTDDGLTELYGDHEVDPLLEFDSRYAFGVYLGQQLAAANFDELISPVCDGLWAWLALIYFRQLSEKGVRRSEHYVVTRKGAAGSLAYRHAARTSFELVHIHGQSARICLGAPMHTFGDLTEQLASRQTVAHNRGFFETAYELYVKDGQLKRGASSKPKKPKERKPGDRTGFGSVRRLAVALTRLDLTYDTEEMGAEKMKAVLPREFAKWSVATRSDAT